MAHQVGNGCFAESSLGQPGTERVTQIVPMEIGNSRQSTRRRERFLNVFVRLGGIRIEEDVTVAANSASYLLQRASNVFVHRHSIVSSVLEFGT